MRCQDWRMSSRFIRPGWATRRRNPKMLWRFSPLPFFILVFHYFNIRKRLTPFAELSSVQSQVNRLWKTESAKTLRLRWKGMLGFIYCNQNNKRKVTLGRPTLRHDCQPPWRRVRASRKASSIAWKPRMMRWFDLPAFSRVSFFFSFPGSWKLTSRFDNGDRQWKTNGLTSSWLWRKWNNRIFAFIVNVFLFVLSKPSVPLLFAPLPSLLLSRFCTCGMLSLNEIGACLIK